MLNKLKYKLSQAKASATIATINFAIRAKMNTLSETEMSLIRFFGTTIPLALSLCVIPLLTVGAFPFFGMFVTAASMYICVSVFQDIMHWGAGKFGIELERKR